MITTDFAVLASRRFDICVVGSGPVGLCLAIDAAYRGLSVLVLESGLATPDRRLQSLADAEIESPDQHMPMSAAVSRCLGGTSRWWGGRCVPLDEVDFLRREYVPNSGWSIAYDAVARHVKRAAELVGCDDGDFVARDASAYGTSDVDFGKLERWVNETRIVRQHPELEQDDLIVVLLNATAVGIDIEPAARAITGLRVAREGQRAAFSGATHYILALGGVENARLLLNAQCEHPRLFGGESGPLGRYYMGHISGSWTKIRFYDQSGRTKFSEFRGKKSFARRRLTITKQMQLQSQIPNVAFWPENFPLADAAHKSGTLSFLYLLLNAPGIGRSTLSDAIRKMQMDKQPTYWPHFKNMIADVMGLTAGAADLMWQRFFYGRRLPRLHLMSPGMVHPLHFHAEQEPDSTNRIRLGEKRDRLGLHRVRVELRFHAREFAPIGKAHEILDRGLRESGIGELIDLPHGNDRPLDVNPDGLHQIGSTRMSDHPSTGVVNGDCRTFEFENLYVAGSSVFSTSGQASPTLPAIALAVRLSEHITRRPTGVSVTTRRLPNCVLG